MEETEMKVIEKVSRYARKNTEHSVWIAKDEVPDQVDGAEFLGRALIFCAHPNTDPERAHVIAEIWRIALAKKEGQEIIQKASEEGF